MNAYRNILHYGCSWSVAAGGCCIDLFKLKFFDYIFGELFALGDVSGLNDFVIEGVVGVSFADFDALAVGVEAFFYEAVLVVVVVGSFADEFATGFIVGFFGWFFVVVVGDGDLVCLLAAVVDMRFEAAVDVGIVFVGDFVIGAKFAVDNLYIYLADDLAEGVIFPCFSGCDLFLFVVYIALYELLEVVVGFGVVEGNFVIFAANIPFYLVGGGVLVEEVSVVEVAFLVEDFPLFDFTVAVVEVGDFYVFFGDVVVEYSVVPP